MTDNVSQLVFDLDDTLLDTFGQLIPFATREACSAMIAAGLNTDLDHALLACRDRELRAPRLNLFASLVDRFGAKGGADPGNIAKLGGEAFYNRKVEENISIFPGAREMLASLRRDGYSLHLVTQGHRATQEAKIRVLDLTAAFDSIWHVDPARGESKREAFAALQNRLAQPAANFMSIGNRIDTDISQAKELGWRTCWVRYGEYRHLEPAGPNESPDYTIAHLSELRTSCRL